jgi:lipoprotein NlpD
VTPPEGSAPVAIVKPVSSSAPIEVSSIAGGDASSNLPDNTDTLKREPKGGTVAYSETAWAAAQQGVSGEKPTVVATPEPVAPVSATPEKPAVTGNDVEWQWPANGKLLASFVEGGSKGIDIAGKTGDAVQAAADGVVSYAGSGLRGYGNLVVIRHNATWLSVYAHNSKILVKEKQAVKRGQKIAEMGSTDAASPRLHFEIRQQGKPVDPQTILPAR